MAYQRKKLSDSNSSVSSGGRAQRYWLGKDVKRSQKYTISSQSKEDVDQFEIIKKYKLKGFEYGNWVNNNDRYDRLLATQDSLKDLSKIIGSGNIGLDGTVGVAFGARGNTNALAHFEPNTFMINLTKNKGFGSLAHEYGHALDYFFGMYIDQNQKFGALSGGHSTAKVLPLNKSGKLRAMMTELIDNVITENNKSSESYLNWIKEVGLKAEYWFRRNEIFARVFEQWVGYHSERLGIKNSFLCKIKYEKGMYLTGRDFKRVLPKINLLIKEMSQFMNNKKQIVPKAKNAASIKTKK